MTNLYHAKNGELVSVTRKRLANEDELQAWIAANPRLLGLEVLVLGREVATDFGGRIDILGLDRDGNAVVIECKRDRTPREMSWVSTVFYDCDGLLEGWRKAVIKLLRTALRAGQLISALTVDELEALLSEQERRWWSVKIQSFKSKAHFLRYAGRYVRRPPIAQKRVTYVGEGIVRFWYRDKKLRRRVDVQCSPEEFVERWSQHIPERYRHAVRSFGLFAPRATQTTFDAVFAILGQERRSRPKPRGWAESIKRDFKRDPLLDSKGRRMTWVRRIAPKVSC